MMKRKKPYLLLELLIGIALLITFSIPLMHDPFRLLEQERIALERMELERISEWEFAQVKKQFYRNEIPWGLFSAGEKRKFSTDVKDLFPKLLKGSTFEEEIRLWTKKEKKVSDEEEAFLVGIEIIFTPKRKGAGRKPVSFTYRIFVKRMADKLSQIPQV
jgi:hypothetical protein